MSKNTTSNTISKVFPVTKTTVTARSGRVVNPRIRLAEDDVPSRQAAATATASRGRATAGRARLQQPQQGRPPTAGGRGRGRRGGGAGARAATTSSSTLPSANGSMAEEGEEYEEVQMESQVHR